MLGTILTKNRRYQESAEAHRKQLAIYEQLAAAFADEPDYPWRQANAANFAGVALRYVPKEAEAAARHHRQAIKLGEPLVTQFPDRPDYRRELLRGHWALGLALMIAGRCPEAEVALQAALDGLPPSGDQASDLAILFRPMAASVRNDLAWLLATCPDAKVRDPKRAVELAKKAVELDPLASYWNTLGAAHYRAGSYQEALTALQKSMDLQKGGDAFDWLFVAMAHARLNHSAEARKWFGKAVDWMEKRQSKNEELLRFRAEADDLLRTD